MEVAVIKRGNDNLYKSSEYESSLSIKLKKEKGIYYTPKAVVDYILDSTLKNHDIVKNPEPKVLDLACGCGNFLLEAYDMLYKMIFNNLDQINKVYPNYIKEKDIHKHIIEKCIYGFDIDYDATDILKESLKEKNMYVKVDFKNIVCEDSLKTTIDTKFDYIIGNPPYIGHKVLEKEYKSYLLKEYKEVYRGKADLYFCFYKRIKDILKDDGVSSIITPRYFMESPSGEYLRNFIDKNLSIYEIIDFLGADIFKNVRISSCIVTFSNKKNYIDTCIFRIKNEGLNFNKVKSIKDLIQKNQFEEVKLRRFLGSQWMIIKEDDEKFYLRINKKLSYNLGDIVNSFQGIITGCDKAFILDSKEKILEQLDNKLLKNWVKNKHINKYIINESNLKLIYSNDLNLENSRHNSIINEHISNYKDKLQNRRECKNNLRKWYELQWGREKEYFEKVKIMYPYKSCENRFAIDYNNCFCSADVYSFFIKENYLREFSNEYIVGLLNSKVYNKYFKIIAKKIGKNLYDYYPNKVMQLKIFKDENYEKIERFSSLIIKEYLKHNFNVEKVNNYQYKIDNLIAKSLNVSELI